MAKSGKYSWKERLNLQELYETFLGLAPREQMAAGAGIAVVLLLIIVIPVACASHRLSKMQVQIDSHEKNISKIVSKIGEFNDAKAKLKSVEGQIKPKSQVQLRTKIESLANQSNISSNIDSLKESSNPGEDFEELVVDVKMSKLQLSQIIEFIFGVEGQNDLKLHVNRIQLKPRYDNRQQFDVDFEVSTLVSKDEGST